MQRVRLLFLCLCLCLFPALPLGAQGYFGQNQVQFQKFNWKVLKTEHFDIHYYPEETQMARLAGSMAERSYARLSRVMNYQFKERKPIIVFASRGAFAQNNVFGDLGEGTGGVTDALRQRNMFFFTGDLGESEHVLTHEMVHQFQYDVFSRGRAGQGLDALQQRQPPLWFAEGMAEYLSVGPMHPATDGVIRDAALSGKFPTVEDLERRPDQFFPYRYGESLFRYVGARWGDEVIGEIMQSTPTLGYDRAFKRQLGLSLEELGGEWKDAMQAQYLPQVGQLDRPRKIATSLLTERKTGGVIPVYVAPALSGDGRHIAYISTGSLVKAEVFLDLYLADAQTGKRLKRLTNSTLNPEFEELRYAYSQSAFSRDGNRLAFTAQRAGRDVLYVLDVNTRRVLRRLDTGLDAMVGPSWSPDGTRLVFSGLSGGISDLYVIDADGSNLRRLTNDVYGDVMPAWSPDGSKIAFASERGPQTQLDVLRFGKWQISVLDLASGTMTVLPGQAGKNMNPQWAPDGKTLAFISDRAGIPQVFLYDFADQQHYQLTHLVGGVQSVTENSPALTWAADADRMAFVYSENNTYTVWQVSNPRALRTDAYRAAPVVARAANDVTPTDSASIRRVRERAAAEANVSAIVAKVAVGRDSVIPQPPGAGRDPRRQSVYRGDAGLRATDKLPENLGAAGTGVSVAVLLDSAAFALPDTSKFVESRYPGRLRPEYIARPQVGYAQDNYGRGVYGGTAIVLSDLVGNRHLALAGGINGRIEEAQVFAAYTSQGGRFQYTAGIQQQPSFFLLGAAMTPVSSTQAIQEQALARYIQRSAFLAGLYPLNRFNRFEYGVSFNNIDRSLMFISYGVDYAYGYTTQTVLDSIVNMSSLNFVAPYAAYVHDNTINGLTGPIYGQRYRFELEHAAGNLSWTNYNVDYRRYDALLFSYLTLATRVQTAISVGSDSAERNFPKYIGRSDLVRGYDRENYYSSACASATAGTDGACSATQLLGSRVAFANVELRFPVFRPFRYHKTNISFIPIDGLIFADAGMAWSKGQTISTSRPVNYDWNTQRYPLRSYGYGFRVNLFNFAILRIDKSYPLDASSKKGYWFWTLGPSF